MTIFHTDFNSLNLKSHVWWLCNRRCWLVKPVAYIPNCNTSRVRKHQYFFVAFFSCQYIQGAFHYFHIQIEALMLTILQQSVFFAAGTRGRWPDCHVAAAAPARPATAATRTSCRRVRPALWWWTPRLLRSSRRVCTAPSGRLSSWARRRIYCRRGWSARRAKSSTTPPPTAGATAGEGAKQFFPSARARHRHAVLICILDFHKINRSCHNYISFYSTTSLHSYNYMCVQIYANCQIFDYLYMHVWYRWISALKASNIVFCFHILAIKN